MDTTFRRPSPEGRQRALGFAKRAHFDKEPVMHINFVSRVDGPQRLICEGELIFDADGPLAGLRLVGFCLWRGTDGATYVTFPSRAFGAGDERRFFDYLRGDAAAVKRFKAFVLDAFTTQGVAPAMAAAAPAPAEAADEPAGGGAAKRPARKRMN